MDLSIKKVSIKTRRSSAPFIILMLTLDSRIHSREDSSLSIKTCRFVRRKSHDILLHSQVLSIYIP